MEATGALFTVEGEAALAETNAQTKEGGVYYIAHGKQLCRFWNGTPGSCRRGDACTFVHQQWRKSDRGTSLLLSLCSCALNTSLSLPDLQLGLLCARSLLTVRRFPLN